MEDMYTEDFYMQLILEWLLKNDFHILIMGNLLNAQINEFQGINGKNINENKTLIRMLVVTELKFNNNYLLMDHYKVAWMFILIF